MNDLPRCVCVGVVLGQAVAEYAAMLRTGTLRRRHRREWTCDAVAIAEHLYLQTRPTTPMILAGSLLGAAGIVHRVWGQLALAGAFSPYVERTAGQRLTQPGLYAKIRHPTYTGTILLFIGLPLLLAAPLAGLLSALGTGRARLQDPEGREFSAARTARLPRIQWPDLAVGSVCVLRPPMA